LPKEVRKAEENLRTTQCGTARHLLLAFAALSEPVRGGDLGRVRVCTENELPETGNYLTATTGGGKTVLVLRDHKTSHAAKIGTLGRVHPKQLADVAQASLLAVPRDWLFEAPRGGPFKEEAQFTAWANRIYKEVFGRAVTANILRQDEYSCTGGHGGPIRALSSNSDGVPTTFTNHETKSTT